MYKKRIFVLVFMVYACTGFGKNICMDFYAKNGSKNPSLPEYVDDLAKLQLDIFNQPNVEGKSVLLQDLKYKIRQVSDLFNLDVRALLATKFKSLLSGSKSAETAKKVETPKLSDLEFNEGNIIPINYGNSAYGRKIFTDFYGNILLGTGNFNFNPNGQHISFDLERISSQRELPAKETVFKLTQRPEQLMALTPDHFIAVKERRSDDPYEIILLDDKGNESFIATITMKNYNYIKFERKGDKFFLVTSEGKISLIDFDSQTLKVTFTELPQNGVSEIPKFITVTDKEIRVAGKYGYQHLWVKNNGHFEPVDITKESQPFKILDSGDRVYFDTSKKTFSVISNDSLHVYPMEGVTPLNVFQLANGNYVVLGTVVFRDANGNNWNHAKLFLVNKDSPQSAIVKFDLPGAAYVQFKQFILTKTGWFVGVVDRNETSHLPDAYRTDDIISYKIDEPLQTLYARNIVKLPSDQTRGVSGDLYELPNGNLFFSPYASGQAFVIPLMEKIK